MNSLNLYAVGDCNTEGANALPEEANLPAKLTSLFASSGKRVNLINLGHTMTTTREGLARVENEVNKPDLLLINFGLVDAWVTSIPQVYVPYYPDNSIRKLGRKILKLLKKLLRHPVLKSFVTRGEVVSAQEYVGNIEKMVQISRSRNPDVQILLWGTTLALNNPERNMNIRYYNSLLKSLAHDLGTLYLDIEDIVEQLPASEAYLDDVHLSSHSSALIAEAMFQMLNKD